MTKRIATGLVGKAILYNAADDLYSVKMTVAEFTAIPRCPFQRNEKMRVNKRHLRKPARSHKLVAIAALPDGRLFKVDGHTRIELIALGRWKGPDAFLVNVFSLESYDEIEALYDSYDSDSASKKGPDVVQSGVARANLKLKTPWLAAGQFASGMDIASTIAQKKNVSKKSQVEFFAKELQMLDSINPIKGRFIIGQVAAALLILKKHGISGLDFLRRHNESMGFRAEGEFDAVAYLDKYIFGAKAAGNVGGKATNRAHAAVMLGCHAHQGTGKRMRKSDKPVALDLSTYL